MPWPGKYLEAPEGFTFQNKIRKRKENIEDGLLPGFYPFPAHQVHPAYRDEATQLVRHHQHDSDGKSFWGTMMKSLFISFMGLMAVDFGLVIAARVREIRTERQSCERDWVLNACFAPVPRMEEECAKLKLCVEMSLEALGLSRVVASGSASILNSFFDEVSLKAVRSIAIVRVVR
ncbi:hypothetical protein D9757_010699 [Collybiopsis confluens]|uniref:Brl1/Brr6 domain-containing protein n=1 Tax=Collybiopsis confluens TaxID=2823264 RepID=A0A8H5M3F3_9AGAR|nr:hypothetical protein D9757_015499 [Collybiopsis confluens]KAF5334081.1 hypothetical protein D9757_015383 [Collybiopsis confluens]KAF5377355.1 hypothetical protein D9757_008051 [Collybiopsis confluens]KAF5379281.1 hypothetical protein D9757_010699 [Collybiopsis confluens]